MNAKEAFPEDNSSSVTFAFGHVVGLGIQEYITHHSVARTYLACFLAWDCDLLQDNPKQAKSFWLALAAVDRFIAMVGSGYMEDWELASYKGRPATELSFIIHIPSTSGRRFTYKGFVDAVLVHKHTGEVMVLEAKTTSSSSVAAASYKNSFQAIGYSIVLDALFPKLSSYTVQYLIYRTKGMEFDSLPFEKSYLDRALWIRTLLLDVQQVETYEDAGIYPMRGESCYSFFRECEYFGICTLSTEVLTTPLTEEERAEIERHQSEDFEIVLSVQELIDAQLAKACADVPQT